MLESILAVVLISYVPITVYIVLEHRDRRKERLEMKKKLDELKKLKDPKKKE